MSTSTENSDKQPIILADLLRFYLPLGLYSMIMMSSHSVINAGVSRTLNPEIGLAAYALTNSIMNMFASPTFTTRQMLVALAHDKDSFKTCFSVIIRVAIISLTALGLMAFTPMGEFVFIKIFNASPELFPEIKIAARFCITLPFTYSLRAYAQGIIIVQRKTQYMTYSVIIRILFMISMAIFLPNSGWLPGAAIGIVIWTAGMLCEAICNFLFAIPLYRKLPQTSAPEKNRPLTISKAFNFIWPLLLVSIVWTLGRPLLNFGLTRTTDPEMSLATFQVAQNFAWILMASLESNMRQVALIYGKTKERVAYLKKFTFTLSIILASILAILAFTPLGELSLLHIIGVSAELAAASKNILIILIFAPLLIAWTEFYMGLLMGLGNTKVLSIAKMINLTTGTITILALASIYPQLGASAGAIGFLIGIGLEMLFLRFSYNRLSVNAYPDPQTESI